MSELIEKLTDIVGSHAIAAGAEVGQRASHFWDASPLQALAVVKPATTDEVSRLLRVCNNAGQAVVTHGGVTGLANGEQSGANDVVLSLERMRAIEEIDAVGKTITVQAGCVLQAVQEAAADHVLQYGVDLGARGSCTIGGNISTNAGGLSVLRYGMTREQVLGMEVVLADGTVLNSMNKLLKNNTGYDLKQLFIGSEGTLGVVTRAVLRLRPATPGTNTAIVAFDSFTGAMKTLSQLNEQLNAQLNAFEIIWNEFYQLSTNESVEGASRAPLSREYPLYAIVETRGLHVEHDQKMFVENLEKAIHEKLIVDAVIAQSEKDRTDIWQIRENVDLVLRHSPAFIYDISLPIASMEHYIDTLKQRVKNEWPESALYAYGHMADSNLHITIAPTAKHRATVSNSTPSLTEAYNDQEKAWYAVSNRFVFEPLQELGGSVSAEHGIGLLKKPYLHYCRTNEEIQTMQTLKRALDPNRILNPGKIID